MATAEGPHAELLHSMCQRRFWDTLDLRQYLARIDKPPHLRLEPSQGRKYASKPLLTSAYFTFGVSYPSVPASTP